MMYLVWAVILTSSWILPWWMPPLAALVIGFLEETRMSSIKVGFFGFFPTWLAIAYTMDMRHHGLVSERLAGVFGIHHGFWIYLLVGLMGGFLGALTAWLGHEIFLTHTAWKLRREKK